jgi:hypothetical protein
MDDTRLVSVTKRGMEKPEVVQSSTVGLKPKELTIETHLPHPFRPEEQPAIKAMLCCLSEGVLLDFLQEVRILHVHGDGAAPFIQVCRS